MAPPPPTANRHALTLSILHGSREKTAAAARQREAVLLLECHPYPSASVTLLMETEVSKTSRFEQDILTREDVFIGRLAFLIVLGVTTCNKFT
eukprot:scaffold2561_cov262-Alexandrium_tamarense.AAC.7